MTIRARTDDYTPTVEMTPMIDMVFNLLIFFLVASSFRQVEREMKIVLPAAANAAPMSAMLRELVVNVDARGAIIVNGRTIDAAELTSIVSQAVSANPDQKVLIRGDRGTAYANVVRVLDICKAGGIQEPFLDTVLSE